MSLFSPLMKRKRKNVNSSTIFEEFYINLRRKIWKFLTLDNLNTQKIELHKNPCWRNSRNETISLTVIYPNNRLLPLQILSHWESTVVAPIYSLIYNILFSFSWLSIIQILFWNRLTVCWLPRLPTQNNPWDFWTIEQKATIFFPPWSDF